MPPTFQERALACFLPPLPAEAVPQVLEELQDIIDQYAKWGSQHIVINPIRRIDESEEDYQNRCSENARAPRKRGRPGYISQRILLYRLKDLLGRAGCNYGSYFDDDACALYKLLDFVHEEAGSPRGDVFWLGIAKKWGNPLQEFKLALGDGLTVTSANRTKLNKALRKAMALAYQKRT